VYVNSDCEKMHGDYGIKFIFMFCVQWGKISLLSLFYGVAVYVLYSKWRLRGYLSLLVLSDT
jgi:hypothetical protein